MNFKGVLLRFDCKNNRQFDDIGKFWDFMSSIYPKEKLKGLGFNWFNNSFDYVIGDITKKYNYKHNIIKQRYPNSRLTTIELPDDGWTTYTGKIKNLTQIYKDIYQNGVLKYEIEE